MTAKHQRVAIITGAGQGVGLGIATALARRGVALVISGRDDEKLERAARALETHGVPVTTLAGDVSLRKTAVRAVALAIERFGRLDILINNAQSIAVGAPLEDVPDEVVKTTVESGLYGTLYHMQAAFPHLKKGGGCIVNLGSREGIVGGLGMSIYAATKEAIRALSRVAAREWGQYNIRVNVVCPAAMTPGVQKYFEEYPDKESYYLAQIPLGRFGEAENDIGRVVDFLTSEDSGYLTGQTINADGGQVML